MNLKETQQDIVDEFSVFEDWLDRYNYLIELGNDLPEIDPLYRTNEYISTVASQKSGFMPTWWMENLNSRPTAMPS